MDLKVQPQKKFFSDITIIQLYKPNCSLILFLLLTWPRTFRLFSTHWFVNLLKPGYHSYIYRFDLISRLGFIYHQSASRNFIFSSKLFTLSLLVSHYRRFEGVGFVYLR